VALQQPMDLAAGAKPRKTVAAQSRRGANLRDLPRHKSEAWKSVTVLKEHETSPTVQEFLQS